MEYRLASINDLDLIKQLETDCFGEAWDNIEAYQILLIYGLSLIAVQDGVPVGYILVGPDNAINIETAGGITAPNVVYTFGVIKEHRCKGIGQTLLHMAIIEDSKLNVRPSNKAAIHIYKKMGFEIVGETASYYEDGESCFIMYVTK